MKTSANLTRRDFLKTTATATSVAALAPSVLADPRVDAVVIATPDHGHCPIVLDAVKAGKDIYYEKGFTRTVEEAKRMRDAIQRSQFVFQLGHQARASTCAWQAKDFCRASRWGRSR